MALLLMLMLIAACGSAGGEDPIAYETPTAVSQNTSTDVSVPAADVPQPTATPSPPSAAALYAELSPSIAFIETSIATGSGVLIDGGLIDGGSVDDDYVLTNHHVLESHATVRVVFPNGTEILDAPVFAQDLHSDLALIGPIDTALPAVDLAASAMPVPGEAVYLLGYPDEYELFPQSTITQGIVSRYRTLEVYDWEFIQVDALIAPGQSGGALFNEWGEFIGTSGLRFGAQDFGLVFRGTEVQAEVAAMLDDPSLHRATAVGANLDFALDGERSTSWMIETTDGAISIEVNDDVDLGVELANLSGDLASADFGIVDYLGSGSTEDGGEVEVDEGYRGTERMDVQVEPGQYIVSVYNYDSTATTAATIDASGPLAVFDDVEDELGLAPGVVARGVFDHVTDRDIWLADLSEGDNVRLLVDSINDTAVVVRGPSGDMIASDDDGFGLMGNGSETEFTVAETGEHTVEVGRFGSDTGGYALRLDIE